MEMDDEDGSKPFASDCGDFLKEALKRGVQEIYDGIWSGKMESLTVLPIESLLPMMFLR